MNLKGKHPYAHGVNETCSGIAVDYECLCIVDEKKKVSGFRQAEKDTS